MRRKRRSELCGVGMLLLGAMATASAAETGSVRIETEPGTKVIWEGANLGLTDDAGVMQIQGIPLGRFTVALEKPGFEPTTATVHVGPRENRLPIPLHAIGAAAASPEIPAVEQVPTSAPVRAAPLEEPTPTEAEGQAGTGPLSNPRWIVAAGGLLLIVLLVARRRRKADAPAASAADIREPATQAAPRVERDTATEAPAPDPGSGFLRDLRQRERALENLVGIEPETERARSVVELDVVDVTPLDDEGS